jgi:hypothetical protein
MLNNRTEGILVVKTIALFKTFGNKTSLISLNGTICMTLNLEHPLGINSFNTRMRRYHMLSTGSLKSLNFQLHTCTPVRGRSRCLAPPRETQRGLERWMNEPRGPWGVYIVGSGR